MRQARRTERLQTDAAGIRRAADLLLQGRTVAFPTETVYGLGAHALDASAVQRVFAAKARPSGDPLIVHVGGTGDVEGVAASFPERGRLLAEHFWPGPLTLVLPRSTRVPLVVTAGLETVGVRVPAHPVARALLDAAGVPVAAPSANRFGRPSPTTADHVLEDLDGRIDAVLDGGPTTVGLESTIVDVTRDPPRLLRPGGIGREAIEQVLGCLLEVTRPDARVGEAQEAPGQLESHYAPTTPLTVIAGPPERARKRLFQEIAASLASGERVGVLALEEDLPFLPAGLTAEVVGSWENPATSARRLYAALRALDRAGLDILLARELADSAGGLGQALSDRLRRAAHRHILA